VILEERVATNPEAMKTTFSTMLCTGAHEDGADLCGAGTDEVIRRTNPRPIHKEF
jgi:hypothetical protein